MSSPPATVTVAIPTYNRHVWLRGAIESVLAQTHGDFRLIVGDNASEDETQAVVESFDDPRLCYVRADRNLGAVPNMNRLIDLVDTEFGMILPDDDLLYPRHLEATVDALRSYPTAGLVHSGCTVLDQDSRLLETHRPIRATSPMLLERREHALERLMSSTWPICFSSVLYRTEALRAAGPFENEEFLSDLRLWMRLALDWDFAYVDGPLVSVRTHAQTLTAIHGTADEGSRSEREFKLRHARQLFHLRSGFLDEAPLEPRTRSWLRSLVTVKFYAEQGDAARPWIGAVISVTRVALSSPRILLRREYWQVVLRVEACRLMFLRFWPGAARSRHVQDGVEARPSRN